MSTLKMFSSCCKIYGIIDINMGEISKITKKSRVKYILQVRKAFCVHTERQSSEQRSSDMT